MKLFLEEADKKRVEVLDYLVRRDNEVTISELTAATHLSNKTVRSILLSFADNTYLEKENIHINYTEFGKIRSVRVENTSVINAGFFYLEQSKLFIFVKELFFYGKLDKALMLRKYHMSESTYNRTKRKLFDILELFELTIVENHLAGNEYKIRHFYNLFFSSANSKWIFDKNAYNQIESDLNKFLHQSLVIDPTQKEMLILLLFVSKIRISQGYVVEDQTSLTFGENSTFEKIYKTIECYVEYSFPTLKNKVAEIQSLFIFCLRAQIIRPENSEVALDFVLENNEKIRRRADYLTKLLFATFFKNNNELYPFIKLESTLFVLYANFVFLDSRIFSYVYTEEYYKKNHYEKQLYDKVKQVVETIVEDFPDDALIQRIKTKEKIEVVENQLYLLIYSIYSRIGKKAPDAVNIYVQNSRAHIADIIKGKIGTLFANRIKIADRMTKDVNIFVTDKEYIGRSDQFRLIYLTTFSDEQQLKEVYHIIGEEIIKKINTMDFEG